MQASAVHFNHQTGVVTAEPHPGGQQFTVTEDARELEVTAADEVSVRVDAGMSHAEALNQQPLLVRESDDGKVVAVRTARKPKGADHWKAKDERFSRAVTQTIDRESKAEDGG